jgi:hypothetical protein
MTNISLNKQIKAILTEYGKKIFVEYYRNMGLLDHEIMQELVVLPKSKGFNRIEKPLWVLMKIFGKHYHPRKTDDIFVENIIEIE